MALKYGVNFEKECILDPSEQADKGTQNAHIKCVYDEASSVANGDEVVLFKLQHYARFVSIQALDGALGAGDLKAVDKDGNETVIAAGDLINGQIEGGLNIVLEADALTSASLKVLIQFLMD